MTDTKVLVYLLRRDLRVADNPILNALATGEKHGFTHLLPVYIFPAQQIEVSGFIDDDSKSPYPEARSQVGSFWRCGPHRAKFIAESVWDLKGGLEQLHSGLCVRVGMIGEITRALIGAKELNVAGIWMTSEEGVEEKREERDVKKACEEEEIAFKLWIDEKYFIDDRDVPFRDPKLLPDVFTTYKKMVEPLREKPRSVLPTPKKGSLPPFPDTTTIPSQHAPFAIPTTLSELKQALAKPLNRPQIANPPAYQRPTTSAHPFTGGETEAHKRLMHLCANGVISRYKSTRNGLLGVDFSTKISGYLSQGCLTARQVHAALLVFEDGKSTDPSWKEAEGYGKGVNEGTTSVRYELVWRDYMRLCSQKFGPQLFALAGFMKDPQANTKWSSPAKPRADSQLSTPQINDIIQRFLNGTTGMGLIDASQRELYHTGYTSNRARQNVASFLAKHLYIDWRLGAEWYESMLVDYDVSSNWGNWQYVAGVGNDPRGEARVFNPVKQAYDYDPRGEYVMAWVDELRGIGSGSPGEIFQVCTMKFEKVKDLGLVGNRMVESPLKKIEFHVDRNMNARAGSRGRARGGGGRGRGNFAGGRGYGGGSRGGRAYHPNQVHQRGGGGRETRSGIVDKEMQAEEERGESSLAGGGGDEGGGDGGDGRDAGVD